VVESPWKFYLYLNSAIVESAILSELTAIKDELGTESIIWDENYFSETLD
jgi:hypothetical protein